eukprot:9351295-Pyramimonas_sp.AAC.1
MRRTAGDQPRPRAPAARQPGQPRPWQRSRPPEAAPARPAAPRRPSGSAAMPSRPLAAPHPAALPAYPPQGLRVTEAGGSSEWLASEPAARTARAG